MKRNPRILTFFLLIGPLLSLSQTNTDFHLLDSLVEKAKKYREQKNYQQAAYWYKEAGVFLQQQDSLEQSVMQYLESINMHRLLGETDSMLHKTNLVFSLLSKADSVNYELTGLAHHQFFKLYQLLANHQLYKFHGEQTIQAYSHLPRPLNPKRYLAIAGILTDIEENERAILYCDSVLLTIDQLAEKEQAITKINALNTQNRIYNHKGQFSRLLENANLMGELAIQDGRENILPFIANAKAIAYEMSGDLERAISFYKQSVDLRIIDLNIGRAYSTLEEYDSARKYIERALIPSRADPFYEEPGYPGELYWHSGEVYARMGEYDLSDFFFKKSVEFSEANQYPLTLAEALHDWGYYLYKRDELDRGSQHILRAIQILEHEKVRNNQFLISSYYTLGRIQSAKRQWDSASQSFDHSIDLLRLSRQQKKILPEVDEVLYPQDYLHTLSAIIPNIYNKDIRQDKELAFALEACHKAVDALTLIRQNIRRASSKEISSEKAFDICEFGVQIAYELYQRTQDLQYMDEAFFFSEQSKSILLKESLQKNQAMAFAGLSDSLLQEEKEIKADLAHYWQEYQVKLLDPQADSTLVVQLRQKLDLHTEKYHMFEELIEKQYPAYFHLFSNQSTQSLNSVQEELQEREAGLIEYFWSKEGVFVLGVSGSKKIFTLLDTTKSNVENLQNTLEDLYKVSTNTHASFIQKSNRLYHWLLSPFLGQLGMIERLIIVPDGPLGYFPFGMLAQEGGGNEARYLIERYPISYANSATLLLHETKEKREKTDLPYAGFAPTYSGQLRLPYNQEEVQQLQSQMGGEGFISSEASEFSFHEVSNSAQILHFAMHGILNSSEPMQSHLLFSETDTTSKKDGKLYAYELYNLEIGAELAVLSACHTGYGPIAKGEGIRSLARAFQYAGCPSIVMSLWEANGVVAKELMPFFYAYLKEGFTKDVALQKAKMDYIKTAPDHLRDPRMWGNFVLIGDSGVLTQDKQNWPQVLFIGGLLILTLGLGLMGLRRTRS